MRSYQVVRSKLKKTRVLQMDESISQYIPETMIYNYKNLKEMLSRYPLIFVKPDMGSKGFEIVVVKKNYGEFTALFNSSTLKFQSIEEVSSFLEEFTGDKKFHIQQGIDALNIDNRPFSVRVWVQKPYKKWRITGITAVLAAPKKIITNYHQGGTLFTFKEIMMKIAGADVNKVKNLTGQLYFIGEKASRALNQRYRGLRELGIDIALDQTFRPWILEVNTMPMIIIGNPKIRHYHSIIKKKYRKRGKDMR